jgi:hypothetical protein
MQITLKHSCSWNQQIGETTGELGSKQELTLQAWEMTLASSRKEVQTKGLSQKLSSVI